MNRLRTGWVVSLLLSLLVLVTCGGGAPGDASRGPPSGSAACVAGELTLPDGSCQRAGLPPDMACLPGQRAVAGVCQPAGVPAKACAEGRFVSDGRGGCAPILPEESCLPGQMAVPGESACHEVSPCGEGPWAAAIPEEATTEYVDQAYPGSDSDGSRERPWTTVQAGVRASSPGAIVAVAEGRYPEDVVVTGKQVRLWGRCPARTVVVGVGAQRGAITVSRERASSSEVRGLAVTGPRAGIAVLGARSVTLEEIWVHDAGFVGVGVVDRAGATLRRALLEQNAFAGVYVHGAEVTVEATVVRATRPDGAGKFGRGIVVADDSETGERGKLSLTASLVEENHEVGVFVQGSEATVEATVVRATRSNGARRLGRGINVEDDPETGERGKLSLTTSLVAENHEVGVMVIGSEASIETTVVRATQPNGAGEYGPGIIVQTDLESGERGKLSLTASLVEENHDVGVYVQGSEAAIEATVVRATQMDGAREGGRGISVLDDRTTGARGKLSLSASLVEENHDVGVFVEGSEAAIEATVVRATQMYGAREGGMGIVVQEDLETGERGKLSLAASLVAENHEVGVFVMGSEAAIEASVVRATRSNGAGEYGRGINVQIVPETGRRGELSLAASLVEENHDVGVFIEGSEATIAATVVRATRRSPAGLDIGDGILVDDELGQSNVSITATESTDNARVGVLSVGGTGKLSFVRSSGNRFGLVLQPGTSGEHPTLLEGNTFEGNTEVDKVLGGDMEVPNAVVPLP